MSIANRNRYKIYYYLAYKSLEMETLVKILYVDDEPVNLLLFEQMFNKKYIVLKAESGFKGLDMLQRNPDIEVVVSDMKMPGMNGLEFINKVHALYPNILLYIFSGYDLTPEIQQSMDQGLILKYFQKPFNMRIIDDAIAEALQSK